MRSLSYNPRRALAALVLTGALALSATACSGLPGLGGNASDSDACSKHLSGGNVTTCFGVSDVSTSKGDAVILVGAQVTIVCKHSDGVGIIIPKSIVGADLSKVEWKTKNGTNAARGISTSYFSSVPGGLADCNKVLKPA